MTKRIGLFGGTFDPVHFGHLRAAEELAERYALNLLHLLPNHRPTHRGPTGASSEQRIAMLRTAIGKANSALSIDTREALRGEPTYTYDTLVEIRSEQTDATIVFFLGMDAFAAFDTWYRWQDVLEMTNLVVVNRPDAEHSAFSQNLLKEQIKNRGNKIVNGQSGVIEICDVTQLSISATDIRRRIAQQKTIRFLLPDGVCDYISKNGLYVAE